MPTELTIRRSGGAVGVSNRSYWRRSHCSQMISADAEPLDKGEIDQLHVAWGVTQ